MKTYNSIFFIKHIKLLFGLFLVLTLANCSKDDDNPQPEPTTQELLMSGKWYWENVTGLNQTLTECNKKSYFLFSENTLTQEIFSEDSENNCVSNQSQPYSYQLNKDSILVDSNGETFVLTIDFISNKKLVLTQVNGSEKITFTCIKP